MKKEKECIKRTAVLALKRFHLQRLNCWKFKRFKVQGPGPKCAESY